MSSPTGEDRPSAGLSAVVHGRRLSAILHSDLAGYTRLMAGAEDRTVRRLKSVRAEVWRPAVETAGGRIVNIVADSVLAEFSSAAAAVAAAIDVQQRMARFNDRLDGEQRLLFRIGLHLGQVIVDETETLFGDAVNVAARIQLMAEPGGIAASAEIRDATRLETDVVFIDGGKRHARNVSRPLRIYHVGTRESAPRPLIRAASRIWRPALRGTIAAAALLLLIGGTLVFTAKPTSVDSVASNLSVEQLERAQAERRKAERELAQLKADIEAQRQAEADRGDRAAVAQRAAEEAGVQRKAEAEAAIRPQAEPARVIVTATAIGQRKQAEAEVRAPATRPPSVLPAFQTVAATSGPPAHRPPESADGLWRGIYECGKGDGNFVPFALKPEIRLKDRTGTWYAAHPSWTNDQTYGISVSIDGTSVLVTRRGIVGSTGLRGMPLLGRFAGNSIRANNGVCTMALIRDASL